MSQMQKSRKRLDVRRAIRPISTELLEHCTNYLEEQLYTQGLATLSSALLSGTNTGGPAFVPPAQHLAFITTLSVHPQFTTRTAQHDKQLASRACLRYVRDAARVTAYDDLMLSQAFSFEHVSGSNREQRARLRHSHLGGADDTASNDARSISSSFANAQSLYRNAEDFWHVVGWAFNCSVHHRARWLVWEAWLQVMIDTLEDNFHERDDARSSEQGAQQSLILQYLSAAIGGRCNVRRVLRAIFADGSAQSIAQFPEVWRNETLLPTVKDEKPEKRRKLDIENDEYADYFDHGSDDDVSNGESGRSSTSKSRSSRLKVLESGSAASPRSPRAASPASTTTLGDSKSIRLRCRLLALLVSVSQRRPDQFVEYDELLLLLAEFLRPLPVSVFAQFVLPVTPFLAADEEISFREVLCKPLIASAAPINADWSVSRDVFTRCYAPFSASTTSANDNAKLSLLIEGLLRSLLDTKIIAGNERAVRQAVEVGIASRRKKIGDGGGKGSKRQETDSLSRSVLECSELRMRSLLS